MKVTLSTLSIRGSRVDGENPLPQLCDRERDHKLPLVEGDCWPLDKQAYYGNDNGYKLLPYRLKDRYERRITRREYRCVVLENENLKAVILPDFGGKLYSLTDKRTGRDLIFKSSVLRFVNFSAVDAWTAGGVEWNLGYHQHTYFSSATVFVSRLHDDKGNEFVRIYEYERMRGLYFQLDFHLPKGTSALFTHGRVVNDTGKDVFFDWWSDMGINETPGMRILSGADDVVYFQAESKRTNSGLPYSFGYCPQETMCERMGFDVTYPEYFKYATEYFLQGPEKLRAPWIAAVYPDGFIFFNRSTDRMKNKKMYTWGTQTSGLNWRDYLIEPGAGNHLEIQSGMATTQTHTLLFKTGETWRWTEAFSCATAEDMQRALDPSIANANSYIYTVIDAKLTEDEIYNRNAGFKALETREPDEILVQGTGFGTLERLRRETEGRSCPKGMLFPITALTEKELPWLRLLQTGSLEEVSQDTVPCSWMGNDDNWFKLLSKSLNTENGYNHTALTHMGVMMYERYDFDGAIEMWEKSIELQPTAIAFRNLAQAYDAIGDKAKAESYMCAALDSGGSVIDIAFSEEYLKMLVEHEKYEHAWEYFVSIPDYRLTDNLYLFALIAAVETGNEEYVSKELWRPLKNMREYDNDMFTAEVWYKYMALKKARECCIPYTAELLDEIKSTLTVPRELDFRIVV